MDYRVKNITGTRFQFEGVDIAPHEVSVELSPEVYQRLLALYMHHTLMPVDSEDVPAQSAAPAPEPEPSPEPEPEPEPQPEPSPEPEPEPEPQPEPGPGPELEPEPEASATGRRGRAKKPTSTDE